MVEPGSVCSPSGAAVAGASMAITGRPVARASGARAEPGVDVPTSRWPANGGTLGCGWTGLAEVSRLELKHAARCGTDQRCTTPFGLPSHSSGSRTYPYVSTKLAPDPGWHEISTRKHKRGPPVCLVRYAPRIVTPDATPHMKRRVRRLPGRVCQRVARQSVADLLRSSQSGA